mgnify:CR=1 FL=1
MNKPVLDQILINLHSHDLSRGFRKILRHRSDSRTNLQHHIIFINKDYGALSLAVQYYAAPYIVANVPPNCFMPRPKVGSAVIHLKKYSKPPIKVEDEKLMFQLIVM